jgi:hypothetical protein
MVVRLDSDIGPSLFGAWEETNATTANEHGEASAGPGFHRRSRKLFPHHRLAMLSAHFSSRSEV